MTAERSTHFLAAPIIGFSARVLPSVFSYKLFENLYLQS